MAFGLGRRCAAGYEIAVRTDEGAVIADLAVRKAWRGRGVARALLARPPSALLRDRAETIARLYVDAQNVTNAVRVYEAAGMHVSRRFDVLQKQIGYTRGVVMSDSQPRQGAAKTTIAPNLIVRDTLSAIAFYVAAFGAVELYRVGEEAGVAQLAIGGAEFWLAGRVRTSAGLRLTHSPAAPSA